MSPRRGSERRVGEVRVPMQALVGDQDSEDVVAVLKDWLTDYNYRRVHGSLGVTPNDRWAALEEIPSWDAVLAAFDPKKEMNYVEWLTLKRMRVGTSKK